MNKICTTIEQSKKLIELGIDVETADMCWQNNEFPIGFNDTDAVLAWSLSALLELIPPYIGKFNQGIDFGFSKSMNGTWYSAHYIQLNDKGLATFNRTITGDTTIDAAFEMVVWLKENDKI